MSARGRVMPSTRADPELGAGTATGVRWSNSASSGGLSALLARVGVSRLSASAWGAIGATVSFIALTCWWLTVDHSVPVFDAGDHLEEALIAHKLLAAGDILGPFNHEAVYPPLGHLVGALGAFVGGVNVSAPIVAENVVFVSLLTLGCYQTGRLLFGQPAGMLAAIFVLGSPLLIVQFHVFMLDAPEAAMVAVATWLILASERFSRVSIAGLAGLVVGAGVIVKVQFPLFIVGLVLVGLLRGGWRNWRGFLTFSVAALAVGAPWYLDHIANLEFMLEIAGANPGVASSSAPALFTGANLTWYFWSTLNSQLLAPLFLLALGGTVWLVMVIARRAERWSIRLDFLVGLFTAWFAVTMARHHDIRYDIPLMPYLAVIGTGWIVFLRPTARFIAIALLVGAVAANTLGNTFGVGGNATLALTHPLSDGQAFPDRVTFYNNEGFLVAGPKRDGDVPGLVNALGRQGVRLLTWNTINDVQFEFSSEGISALAYIAGMTPFGSAAELAGEPRAAGLIYQERTESGPAPCTRLAKGAGVWVAREDPAGGKVRFYCPYPQPHYYGAALKLG